MAFWNGSCHIFRRFRFAHLCDMLWAMCKIKLKIGTALHLYQEMIREVCKNFSASRGITYLKQRNLKNIKYFISL